jgi:hypothetical protein
MPVNSVQTLKVPLAAASEACGMMGANHKLCATPLNGLKVPLAAASEACDTMVGVE